MAGEDKTDGFCDHLDHPVQFLLTTTLGFDLKESYEEPSYFIEWDVAKGRHAPRTFGLLEALVAIWLS